MKGTTNLIMLWAVEPGKEQKSLSRFVESIHLYEGLFKENISLSFLKSKLKSLRAVGC